MEDKVEPQRQGEVYRAAGISSKWGKKIHLERVVTGIKPVAREKYSPPTKKESVPASYLHLRDWTSILVSDNPYALELKAVFLTLAKHFKKKKQPNPPPRSLNTPVCPSKQPVNSSLARSSSVAGSQLLNCHCRPQDRQELSLATLKENTKLWRDCLQELPSEVLQFAPVYHHH